MSGGPLSKHAINLSSSMRMISVFNYFPSLIVEKWVRQRIALRRSAVRAYLGRVPLTGPRDASSLRREEEDVRMHVEYEQHRRAPRLCRPATGALPG